MSRTPFAFLGFFLLVGAAGASYDTDERSITRTAAEFLRRVAPHSKSAEPGDIVPISVRRSENGSRNGVVSFRWSVSSRFCVLSVDDSSGDIMLYNNGRLENLVGGPGPGPWTKKGISYYRSVADLTAKAREKLNALGWHNGPDVVARKIPLPDPHGQVPHQLVYLKFFDHPFGYGTGQGGNMALIGLDSVSGEIISLQRFTGFKYAPPRLTVSRSQAIKIAEQVTTEKALPDLIFGPIYRELPETSILSKRGEQLCRARTLILAYEIYVPHQYVTVAADTGEVVARVFGDSIGSTHRQKAHHGVPRPLPEKP